MTPGARVAAAIEILDAITSGMPAEQALTRWARKSRFAGSKDRAAIRDYVFDSLRHWLSDAALGGGQGGRARMIGRLRASDVDPETLFHGEGHAPASLSAEELSAGEPPCAGAEAFDVPDWLWDILKADPAVNAETLANTWKMRAPVSIRVNARHTSVGDVRASLEAQGILIEDNSRATHALTVSKGARGLRQTLEYQNGLFELQDAASQAVVEILPEGQTSLDFCAGGGGKSLAMAAQGTHLAAHDAFPDRMRDLPARAERAGVVVEQLSEDELKGRTFDVVLCDCPCSGSGAWRRSPEGKWNLTPERLDVLRDLQCKILETATQYVGHGGTLAYVTCSVLSYENEGTIQAFLQKNTKWQIALERRWSMDEQGDGFYTAHLTRE